MFLQDKTRGMIKILSNKEEAIGKEELYIFITNSLQNDFLETKDLKNDGYWIDYNKIEDKWGNYYENYDGIPIESSIKNLVDIMKKEIGEPNLYKLGIINEVSYHKFLEEYNHRAHIGYKEQNRIWNNEGGLEEFIKNLTEKAYNANEQSDKLKKAYYFIHLRDWHDPIEEKQLEELKTFGSHCIKGSHGAEFIKPLKENIKKNKNYTFIINSNSLSSFADTNLKSVLDSIIKKEKPKRDNIKIGIFGVVTNIKILLLTFELKVVHNFKNVVVCKDFCAAFTKERHKEGKDFIENVLNAKMLNRNQFENTFGIF
jgi:nicotinamidase-related amidase